jgi:hypothetical protein
MAIQDQRCAMCKYAMNFKCRMTLQDQRAEECYV